MNYVKAEIWVWFVTLLLVLNNIATRQVAAIEAKEQRAGPVPSWGLPGGAMREGARPR